MPYAFLNPDGTIKVVVRKPTPFMRVEEGERIVGYNPPVVDDGLFRAVATEPVPEGTLDVAFEIQGLPDEVAWTTIRKRRDVLLAPTDWTQLPDVPIPTKEAWATYRQALRDITDQPDPHTITWPTPPGA